ncbi:hypothetical protein [Methylomagnum ishizawai]|uniref:hypothetical protein n=1 Tax=Methylomagnum ishizawai TaxID=1760988 RepID=UPI001C3303FE|nr:hypothetical protein [Methylomagnum ishizawai]BBL75846.1 hypothetical protein MishRS11D_29440 [Methylomagnum ishizawai]
MSALTLLCLEIATAVGIALATSFYLRPALAESLRLICGSPESQRFWLGFTHLMLLFAPLLCVMLFQMPQEIRYEQLANALRVGLLQILLGIFVALLAVGWNIWHFAHRAAPGPAAVPITEE